MKKRTVREPVVGYVVVDCEGFAWWGTGSASTREDAINKHIAHFHQHWLSDKNKRRKDGLWRGDRVARVTETSVPVARKRRTMLDDLKALMAKATPRPWRYSRDYNEIQARFSLFKPMLNVAHDDTEEADCALVVAAVNALPALVAVAEAARVVADIDTSTLHPADAARIEALADALSALRGVGEGGARE